MSELRKQLEDAQREHMAANYPGDLGSEVLGAAPARRWLLRSLVGLAAGIAMVVGIVMLVSESRPLRMRLATRPVEMETARAATIISTSVPMPQGALSLPAIPPAPSGFSLVPAYQSMELPEFPAFPQAESEESGESPTTKESV